jgi:hypothetical protein
MAPATKRWSKSASSERRVTLVYTEAIASISPDSTTISPAPTRPAQLATRLRRLLVRQVTPLSVRGVATQRSTSALVDQFSKLRHQTGALLQEDNASRVRVVLAPLIDDCRSGRSAQTAHDRIFAILLHLIEIAIYRADPARDDRSLTAQRYVSHLATLPLAVPRWAAVSNCCFRVLPIGFARGAVSHVRSRCHRAARRDSATAG